MTKVTSEWLKKKPTLYILRSQFYKTITNPSYMHVCMYIVCVCMCVCERERERESERERERKRERCMFIDCYKNMGGHMWWITT